MSFLTPRLFEIASLISIGETIADIGTDHAYLPIYIAKEGKAKKIYASDIAEKPLNVARHNLDSFGVKDKIELILSDGISWTLNLKEKIDTVIIAGMGSNTILKILEKDNNNISGYILASQTDFAPIRKWIKNKKYFITYENIIEDNEIIYEIMQINKFVGTKIKNNYDLVFGPLIRKKPTKKFIDKWLQEENKLRDLLNKIPKSEPQFKTFNKRFKMVSKYINKELKKYDKN